jgi:hypothetical protein
MPRSIHDNNVLGYSVDVPSRETEAVVTLRVGDVRSVGDGDLIAVRPLDRSA